MNLAQTISEHARQRPDSIAVSDARGEVSYRDLDLRSGVLARALLHAGLAAGDRVAMLSENGCAAAGVLVAVAKAGGVFVPLNSRAGPGPLRQLLRISRPRFMIVSDRYLDLAEEALESLDDIRLIPLDGAAEVLAGGQPCEAVRLPRLSGEETATLVFSSGTSGIPKGVITSHRKLMHLFSQHVRHCGLSADDRLHLTMPMFHYAGLAGVLGAGLVAGAHVVCFDGRFDAERVLREAALHGVTVEHWIPTTILRVVNYLESHPQRLPALRSLHFGSMPISSRLLARLRAVLDVELIQLYGSTDCGLMARSDDLREPGHEGYMRLIPDSGCRIVDANGTDIPVGEAGEVTVSAQTSGMTGYWNDDERTASTMRDGRIHSGDMARILGDGKIALLGRRDGMIISGGENIYPAEVENMVAGHPAVSEVCVVGRDDEEFGQAVVAVVVLREGASLTLDELRGFGRGRCPSYMLPRQLKIVPHMPRTASGKIALSAVREEVNRSSI